MRCLHQIPPPRPYEVGHLFDDTRLIFYPFLTHTPCYLASILFFLAEGTRVCFFLFAFCTVLLSTLTNCLTYSVGMLLVAFGIGKEMVWMDLLVGRLLRTTLSYFCWDAWRCCSFSCVHDLDDCVWAVPSGCASLGPRQGNTMRDLATSILNSNA